MKFYFIKLMPFPSSYLPLTEPKEKIHKATNYEKYKKEMILIFERLKKNNKTSSVNYASTDTSFTKKS